VALLIVFGVVLARRITVDKPVDQPVADLTEHKPPQPEPAPLPQPSAAAPAGSPKPNTLAGRDGATSPQRSPSLDLGRWSPPANDPRQPSGAGVAQASAGKATPASEAYDPFRGRSVLASPDSGTQAALRAPSPPTATRNATGYSPAGQGGYATTNAAPQPGPTGSVDRYGRPIDDRHAPISNDRYAATPNDRYAPASSDRYGNTGYASAAAPSAIPPAPSPAAAHPAYGDRYGRTPGYGAAAARPTAAPRDGRRENGTYEIQPNDSYWTISQAVYGSGSYFKALAELNRKRIPHEDDLKVGDIVSAPDVAQLEKMYPELCPKPSRREVVRDASRMVSAPRTYGGRTYTTQEGDTLYDIARRELGKATQWVEIYELNREAIGPDYNYVAPGLNLVLPGGETATPADTMTRRPGLTPPPMYQR
jgi:nucleoid-associated protein YgaU